MQSLKIVLLLAIGLYSNVIYSQSNALTKMDNQAIVEQFLAGFNDPSQIQQSLDLLAEDYHFTNPMLELKSKAAFIGLAKEIGAVLTGVEIIRIATADDWVAANYIFKSDIPGVEKNIATEWFRIEDGLIKESKLIYDASQWRKIYAQMAEK